MRRLRAFRRTTIGEYQVNWILLLSGLVAAGLLLYLIVAMIDAENL